MAALQPMPTILSNVLRTFIILRSLSALWALGFASLCIAQLSNPLRVLSKTQPRLDDEYTCGILNRLTDHYFGYGLLVIGYWLLVMDWSMRRAATRAFRL